MLVTILKSFPWHRDTYMQGTNREAPSDSVGTQWIAAGLAKRAPSGAKESPAPMRAKPLRGISFRRTTAVASAPVQKEAGAVGAMTQPQGGDPAKEETAKDKQEVADKAKAPKAGASAPKK